MTFDLFLKKLTHVCYFSFVLAYGKFTFQEICQIGKCSLHLTLGRIYNNISDVLRNRKTFPNFPGQALASLVGSA